MKKNIFLIAILMVLALSFSGCVEDPGPQGNVTDLENPAENESEETVFSETGAVLNLPSGFEYLATLSPMSVDEIKKEYESENVSGIIGGTKSLYKYSDGTDFYVNVIEFENGDAADELVFSYKSSFKPLRIGSRFVEESFNGHFATKITDYVTNGGEDVARYTYIWKNENSVFVVHGNTDNAALIIGLAEATGN